MIVFRSLSSLLAGCLALLSTIEATPTGGSKPVSKAEAAKRQTPPFTVTGVPSGSIQPRLEIRDLQTRTDQFNIFILGLQRMQAIDQANYLSYFQLAGIHGRPMVDWNNVQGNPDSSSSGYCTHVSNLFLSWHRPFLALFEQVLVAYANAVANEFPAGQLRNRYVAAAATLRLPYWDWARSPASGQHVLPDSMYEPRITVTTPSGSQSIDNPLYSYKFHPTDPELYYAPFVDWSQTLRWPTSTAPDAQNRDPSVRSQIDSIQPQLKQRLYTMFTSYDNYTRVSSEAWISSAGPGSYDSMESIHDQIHGAVGGPNYGDMSIIDVSAFDPAFWLHHVMIDRSFAIWQALYPNSYVQPQSQSQASYWYDQGSIQDAASPLKPFRSDANGNFWTSNSVRDHTKFRYTYLDVQGKDQATLRFTVNSLYGPSSTSNTKPKRAAHDELGGNNTTSQGYRTHRPFAAAASCKRLYHLNVRAPKNGLSSSYYIDFFLGKPKSEDPQTWPGDENFLASHAVIAMNMPNGTYGVTIAGVVALNSQLEQLVEQGRLADLNVARVMALLKRHLKWRVRLVDGSSVPIEQIPTLRVSVATVEYALPGTHDEFPIYKGDWDVYIDVTEGKLGGLCAVDKL